MIEVSMEWTDAFRSLTPRSPNDQAAKYCSNVTPAVSSAATRAAGSSVRACPVQSRNPLILADLSCGSTRPRPSIRCPTIPAR